MTQNLELCTVKPPYTNSTVAETGVLKQRCSYYYPVHAHIILQFVKR